MGIILKKHLGKIVLFIGLILVAGISADICLGVQAKGNDNTILDGVYVGDINISGMTKEEAQSKVEETVESAQNAILTFQGIEDHEIQVNASELGISWKNPEVIEEAVELGKQGNIVQRYKAIKDLQYGNKVFDLDLAIDQATLTQFIQEKCSIYDVKAEDLSLVRTDGKFQISGGQTGIEVNVEKSASNIEDYLLHQWNHQDATVDLVVDETKPRGTEEELALVKDVLGTFTTTYATSGSARSANVANGCRLINGTVLYPGDEFSAYNAIKPFSEENGYKLAGSYLNGMVVESLGGGICQVSTTLYNAVLLSELDVTERHNHSMIINYVDPSMDAAIAESSGKDFKFVNTTEHPIYIEGSTANKNITFTVYGVEYRDPGHKVAYQSEVIKKTEPTEEKIIPTSSQGVGYVDVQSAHIGYVAQLWKIVTEDGAEVSREVINKSTYTLSPRTATVGINTDNALYLNRIQEAIATGSIDQVKAVAGSIKNEMAAQSNMTEEEKAIAAYNAALAAQQAALGQQAAQ